MGGFTVRQVWAGVSVASLVAAGVVGMTAQASAQTVRVAAASSSKVTAGRPSSTPKVHGHKPSSQPTASTSSSSAAAAGAGAKDLCLGYYGICITVPAGYTATESAGTSTLTGSKNAVLTDSSGAAVVSYQDAGTPGGTCMTGYGPAKWDVISVVPVTDSKLPGTDAKYAVQMVYSSNGVDNYLVEEFLTNSVFVKGSGTGMICPETNFDWNRTNSVFLGAVVSQSGVNYTHDQAVAALQTQPYQDAWSVITSVH